MVKGQNDVITMSKMVKILVFQVKIVIQGQNLPKVENCQNFDFSGQNYVISRSKFVQYLLLKVKNCQNFDFWSKNR